MTVHTMSLSLSFSLSFFLSLSFSVRRWVRGYKLKDKCGKEWDRLGVRRKDVCGADSQVPSRQAWKTIHFQLLWPSLSFYLFLDAFSHLYKRVCLSVGPSVRPSVRHTRVEFPRNGPNLNKKASGIRKYAIWKTIQRQVRGQLARTHDASHLLSELC